MTEGSDEPSTLQKLQQDVLEMVQKKTADAKLITQLKTYIGILINKQRFEGPLESQTGQFLNTFSPRLISAILHTKNGVKSVAKPYQSILNLYVQLMLAGIVNLDYTTFIDEASDILIRVRSPLYAETSSYSAFSLEDIPSPHYVSNVKTFTSSPVLDTFSQFLSGCKQTDMPHCYVVLRTIRALQHEFSKNAIRSLVECAATRIAALIDEMKPEDLRVVSEDNMSNVINCLKQMTKSKELRQTLDGVNIRMLVSLVKSGVLTQQFKAMSALKKELQMHAYGVPETLTLVLKEQGFIDYFLKDIHHSLVSNFVVIFKAMLKNGTASENDLKRFWVLTVNQHPGLIPYFIKGWRSLISDVKSPQSGVIFRCVAETNKFPDEVLEFISSNAFRVPAQERKQLFEVISKLYFEDSGENDKAVIVKVLGSLVPTDDEFLSTLQDQCMEMIQKGEHLDYALPLFRTSCRNVKSQRAREYFDILLLTISSNAVDVVPYFDLLVKIMETLRDPLTQDEFDTIMKVVSPLMEIDLKTVCQQFFRKVIDIKTDHGSLFNDEFKSKVLAAMSKTKNWTTDAYSFLTHVFKQLHRTPIENGVECEDMRYLWSVVVSSSTCSYELVDFLISLYLDSPIMFIRHCFEKIDSSGSLAALLRLIRSVEDGLELDKIGIEPHVCVPEHKMRTVYLVGNPEYTIIVPRDISFNGFCRRVSATIGRPINQFRLKCGDQTLSQTNFRLVENEITITWTPSYSSRKTGNDVIVSVENIDPAQLPSQILLDPEFSGPLFALLSSTEDRIAARASIILDTIPTLPSEMEKFTDFGASLPDWEQLLSLEHPFLLTYRTKLISKLVKRREMNWIQTFFASGGPRILMRIALSSEEAFPTANGPLLLLRVTKDLMQIPELGQAIDEVYADEHEKSAPALVQWIIKIAEQSRDHDESQLILELLGMLQDFMKRNCEFAKNSELFVSLLKQVLFSSNGRVRLQMRNIVRILPVEYHQELILPLLPLALNTKCKEFFSLLKKVAESTDKTELLFGEIVSVLFSHYQLPTNDVISQLTFKPPSPNYTKGIFKVLNRLVKRMDDIPQTKELFTFLTRSIIFNPLKYYEPTKDLFEVVKTLMDRDTELVDIIVPELQELNQSDNYLTVKSQYMLTSTATARGLKNLGATCYMNSTLQQLFNITELRNTILRTHFDEEDWAKEIQFIFAELSYFPSDWIDTRCFVNKWTDWGGEPINPREQQDAVEFLQMFLERMEGKVKGSTQIFQGEIVHTLVARNNEISPIDSTEQFMTLPLEVKDHDNVEESLRTFLVPDRFEGSNQYKVDEVGLIDADRYHKIRKAPKILIVQLKRFEYDLQKNTRIKVNSHYTFPMVLDLAPVMESNLSVLYDLCGVVMHMGSAQAGHYFSHVKRDNGKWLTLNDCNVKKCNGEQLPEEAAGGRTTSRYDTGITYIDNNLNAYLLFYRMRNSDENDGMVQTQSMAELKESADIDDLSDAENEVDIDKGVLDRLVKSVKKAVMTEVMTSLEVTRLIRHLGPQDKDGKFVYSFLVNFLRTDMSLSNVASLGSQCSDLFPRNQPFADFVLRQKNDFTEFLFANRADTRGLYCCVVTDALKYASRDAVVEVAENLKSGIDDAVNHFESFDVFFKVVLSVVSGQSEAEQEEWLALVTNFLTQTLPNFDTQNTSKKIYLNTNLAAAFEVVRTLIGDSQAKKETFGRILVDRGNTLICQWMLSKSHSFELIELLRVLIEGNADLTNEFLSIFQAEEKDLLPAQLSGMLMVSWRVSDSMDQHRDEIIMASLLKKKVSYIAEIFNDIAIRAGEFSGCLARRFMDLAKQFIRYCLLSSDPTLRDAFMRAVYAVFNYPKDPVSLPDGADTSLLKQLMMALIDFLPKVESIIPRAGDASLSETSHAFTDSFFPLLQWVIITGNFAREACTYAKDFVSIYKKAFDVSVAGIVADVFEFLYSLTVTLAVDQFFNKQTFSKFLSACNGNTLFREKYYATKLLDMIPKAFVGDFVKSDCFRRISNEHFAQDECGERLRQLIQKSMTNENFKNIIKELWNVDVFARNLRHGAFQYLKLSWWILENFPKSANIFFENGFHDRIWRDYIQPYVSRGSSRAHGNRFLRPAAMLLGRFNISFVNENKDKKFTFRGKKVEWLTKHWKEEDVKIPELAHAALAAYPQGRGASGLCVLIKSLITMDVSFARDLLTFLSAHKDGFVCRCPSDAQQEAAMLISTLNFQITLKTDQQAEADSLLVREFVSLSKQSLVSFDIADTICTQIRDARQRLNEEQQKAIAESCDRIYATTRNPKMMGSSLFLIARNLPFGNYASWVEHAVRLLTAEITAGLSKPASDLTETGANIRLLIGFLNDVSRNHSVTVPVIPVQSADVQALASKFQQIEAIDSSDTATDLITSLPMFKS